MPLLARLVIGIVLLALAGACGFGFLASFEYPHFTWWRFGYGAAGLLFFAAAVWVAWPQRSQRR